MERIPPSYAAQEMRCDPIGEGFVGWEVGILPVPAVNGYGYGMIWLFPGDSRSNELDG